MKNTLYLNRTEFEIKWNEKDVHFKTGSNNITIYYCQLTILLLSQIIIRLISDQPCSISDQLSEYLNIWTWFKDFSICYDLSTLWIPKYINMVNRICVTMCDTCWWLDQTEYFGFLTWNNKVAYFQHLVQNQKQMDWPADPVCEHQSNWLEQWKT